MQVSRWDQSSEHDEADLNNLGDVPLTKSNKQQATSNKELMNFCIVSLGQLFARANSIKSINKYFQFGAHFGA